MAVAAPLALQGLGAGLGTASSLSQMFGGNTASSVNIPNAYQSPYTGAAATNQWSGIQGLAPYTSAAASTTPYSLQTFQNLYNNPGAAAATTGAQTASGLGQGQALNQMQTGGQLTQAGLSTIPYATAVMNTGFDPQTDLYNRTLQQTQDQAAVAAARSGVATTPYGAGIGAQTTANFNIDWQNAQLAREAQASQAASGLLSTGAGLASTGTGMAAAAPVQYLQASQYPYTTYAGIGQGQNQAVQSLLGSTGTAQNIATVPIDASSNMVSQGLQAEQLGYTQSSQALQQQQQGFTQDMLTGAMLGSSLYGLGNVGSKTMQKYPNLFGGSTTTASSGGNIGYYI